MHVRRVLAVALGGLVIMWIGECRAMQYVDAVNDGTVAAIISAGDVNRLSVAGDRIADVGRANGRFTYKADEDTGDLFLTVTPGDKSVITFFVVTEKKRTYQLMLTPKLVPGEQVIIRDLHNAGKSEAAAWEHEAPFVDTTANIVKAMILGETPKGYEAAAVDDTLTFLPGLHLVRRTVYRGAALSGEVYDVVNDTAGPVTLDEAEFRRAGVRAVSLGQRSLPPQGTTQVYVVVEESAK